MSESALILTWTGFQDQEVVYPYYRLLAAGFDVDIIADKADGLGRVYGILGVGMPCENFIANFIENFNLNLKKYDLLVLPGGVKALEKLRLGPELIRFIKEWHLAGKVIASTCHGAQLLISAGITQGKVISGYYSLEVDIKNSGATYSSDPVVTDSKIVSSPHYNYMGEWMEESLKVYQSWKDQS